MARVPNYLTKTVGFLAEDDASGKFRGTALLVGNPLEDWDRHAYPTQDLDSFSGKPHADYLCSEYRST